MKAIPCLDCVSSEVALFQRSLGRVSPQESKHGLRERVRVDGAVQKSVYTQMGQEVLIGVRVRQRTARYRNDGLRGEFDGDLFRD